MATPRIAWLTFRPAAADPLPEPPELPPLLELPLAPEPVSEFAVAF